MSSLRSRNGPRIKYTPDEAAPYETITVDKLTPIANSTQALSGTGDVHPTDIVFTPDGKYLVVAERFGPDASHVGRLDTFAVVNDVAQPGNFIAVGLNYADHAAESGMPIPREPVLFNKAPSCVVGPNDDVVIPLAEIACDHALDQIKPLGTVAQTKPSTFGWTEVWKIISTAR